MWGRTVALALGATVAALQAAQPVRAQCRLCAEPSAIPAQETRQKIIALEVEAALDFDRLVLLSAGGGTATLLPDGTRTVAGAVGAISARAMVGRATIRGEPGRTVRIGLPERIDLHSARGGAIAIERIVSDLPALPKLDSAGQLNFRFGGQLHIRGDAEGDYRGDVPITVEYL